MLNKLYSWYGKRTVLRVGIFALLIVLFAIFKLFLQSDSEPAKEEVRTATVEVAPVRNLLSGNSFTTVGLVAAISEARLQTETGGRITSVNVTIGDTVRAGTILASIENSSERAVLLQAQGSYEAAQAAAKQGDSGARDAQTALAAAENNALSAIRASYTSVNNGLISSVDDFFSNPQGTTPGLRVSGDASYLNAERVAFQSIMPQWQVQVAKANAGSVDFALTQSETRTTRMIQLLDAFILITSNADNNETLLDRPLSSYSTGLLADRALLNATLASIQNSRSALTSAREAVTRAALGGTTSQLSVANAQVKIALGSLLAAQSNYEKTVIRTPISGVVNALYIKEGEYVTPAFPTAIIANNGGLEITTAVGQENREGLAIGDVVTLESDATGVISAIAGAVDPTTGKIALKIGVDKKGTLKNGSTVSIFFSKEVREETSQIKVPLSAIKMTGAGPVVFSLTETNTLMALAVTLGAITGESVVVTTGVTLDSVIVVDARGLKEGQQVTLKSQ